MTFNFFLDGFFKSFAMKIFLNQLDQLEKKFFFSENNIPLWKKFSNKKI